MSRTITTGILTAGLVLLAAAVAPAQWCDEDVVTAVADGSSIFVSHGNAEWNCCAFIAFELVAHEHYLDLAEQEYGSFCWCTCCFDLDVVIEGVAPGDYLVRTLDADTDEVLGEAWVTVAGEALTATSATLGDSQQSPCGGWPVTIGGDGSEITTKATWGKIRALYR